MSTEVLELDDSEEDEGQAHPKNETSDPIESGIFELITSPLLKKEGFRHLWLGDSGMGKTVINNALIKWIRRKRLVNLTLTVDDKSAWEVQYDNGMLRVNPNDLRERPATDKEPASHVIFRGIAVTRRPGPDVDTLVPDTFKLAWDLVRDNPIQVLVNVDELADATNRHQSWISKEMGETYSKGRAVGISILATTQLPQLLPREAFGLSETIGIFRLTMREAAYLAKFNVIEEKDVDSIASLKVGEFRLFSKGNNLHEGVFKLEL